MTSVLRLLVTGCCVWLCLDRRQAPCLLTRGRRLQ